ncbi:hypothetical protein NKJ55_14930 [Mesorhizobium sp. M0106]|uniref:hypothetical protein n=1 Tax=Mesorhizobium sp. M0106 TaxID=2956880 RepID=UPI0033357708
MGEAGGDLDRLSGELGFAAQRATRASPALWALRSRSGTIMTIGARYLRKIPAKQRAGRMVGEPDDTVDVDGEDCNLRGAGKAHHRPAGDLAAAELQLLDDG